MQKNMGSGRGSHFKYKKKIPECTACSAANIKNDKMESYICDL